MDEFDFDIGSIITLQDEDGKDVELELFDIVEHNGETYFAFIPTETDLDEVYELEIMKREKETEEEYTFVTLDSQDEFDELYQIFLDRYENSFDEEEDEDEEE